MEPFHFGLAPAPALAMKYTICCWRNVLKNLASQFTEACFIQRKVQVVCFTLPVLSLKRQINFILHYH